MAMRPSWRNIDDFSLALKEIRAGEYKEYAFYWALLFTSEAGLDEKLGAWVSDSAWALDRQTGDHTLVFHVSDDPDAQPTGRDFRPQDVYDIARAFGLTPRSLPCGVFFIDPDNSAETVVVRLERFLVPDPAPEDIVRGMRAIASALEVCSTRPPSGRIDCLRSELVDVYDDLHSTRRPGISERAERIADSSDAVAKTVVNGTTIAAALITAIRALGLSF
jgi:hypothetical protein